MIKIDASTYTIAKIMFYSTDVKERVRIYAYKKKLPGKEQWGANMHFSIEALMAPQIRSSLNWRQKWCDCS